MQVGKSLGSRRCKTRANDLQRLRDAASIPYPHCFRSAPASTSQRLQPIHLSNETLVSDHLSNEKSNRQRNPDQMMGTIKRCKRHSLLRHMSRPASDAFTTQFQSSLIQPGAMPNIEGIGEVFALDINAAAVADACDGAVQYLARQRRTGHFEITAAGSCPSTTSEWFGRVALKDKRPLQLIQLSPPFRCQKPLFSPVRSILTPFPFSAGFLGFPATVNAHL